MDEPGCHSDIGEHCWILLHVPATVRTHPWPTLAQNNLALADRKARVLEQRHRPVAHRQVAQLLELTDFLIHRVMRACVRALRVFRACMCALCALRALRACVACVPACARACVACVRALRACAACVRCVRVCVALRCVPLRALCALHCVHALRACVMSWSDVTSALPDVGFM